MQQHRTQSSFRIVESAVQGGAVSYAPCAHWEVGVKVTRILKGKLGRASTVMHCDLPHPLLSRGTVPHTGVPCVDFGWPPSNKAGYPTTTLRNAWFRHEWSL